jgi:hypothetical protein
MGAPRIRGLAKDQSGCRPETRTQRNPPLPVAPSGPRLSTLRSTADTSTWEGAVAGSTEATQQILRSTPHPADHRSLQSEARSRGILPVSRLGMSGGATGGSAALIPQDKGVLGGCGGADGAPLAGARGGSGHLEGWQDADSAAGLLKNSGVGDSLERVGSWGDVVVEAQKAENLSEVQVPPKRQGEEATHLSDNAPRNESLTSLVLAEAPPESGDLSADFGAVRPSNGAPVHGAVLAANAVVPRDVTLENMEETVPGVPGVAVGERGAGRKQVTDRLDNMDAANSAQLGFEGKGEVEGKAEVRAASNPNPLVLLMRSAERGDRRKLAGQFLFPRFVSEAEEADILRFLDACEPAWKLSRFNGPHRRGLDSQP